MQETPVLSLRQQDPLEGEMATHLVFLPEKPHRQRSRAGHHAKGGKEWAHAHTTTLNNSVDSPHA